MKCECKGGRQNSCCYHGILYDAYMLNVLSAMLYRITLYRVNITLLSTQFFRKCHNLVSSCCTEIEYVFLSHFKSQFVGDKAEGQILKLR